MVVAKKLPLNWKSTTPPRFTHWLKENAVYYADGKNCGCTNPTHGTELREYGDLFWHSVTSPHNHGQSVNGLVILVGVVCPFTFLKVVKVNLCDLSAS